MPQFDRRFLVLPAILGLWFLFQPGGYFDRQHLRHVLARPAGTSTPLERRLAELAEPIAGRPIEVRCIDLSDASAVEPLGRVRFVAGRPTDYMELRNDVCAALADARRAPIRPCETDRCFIRLEHVAEALKALTHEAFHLSGIRDEAVAECSALQRMGETARRYGLGAGPARAFAWFEYRVVFPKLPPAYRSAECRPGGRLDLHTGGPWS